MSRLPFRLTELVDADADGALGVTEGQTGDNAPMKPLPPNEQLGAREGRAREGEGGQPLRRPATNTESAGSGTCGGRARPRGNQ